MKIAPVRYQYAQARQNDNLSFNAKVKPPKGEKWRTVTEYLWEHLRGTVTLPKPDVLEMQQTLRKTPEQMDKFLDELLPPVVRNKNLSEEELTKLASFKIFELEGTKNSFRGPLCYSDISLLKPFNLQEVVLADKVVDNLTFERNTDKIVEFIKTMQADNVYIGCCFGTANTNQALFINQYFNPLCKDKKFYPIMGEEETLRIFQDICDELTPEQKKAMRWTEEFETKLRKKLGADIEECEKCW